jgi:hypothetical protein
MRAPLLALGLVFGSWIAVCPATAFAAPTAAAKKTVDPEKKAAEGEAARAAKLAAAKKYAEAAAAYESAFARSPNPKWLYAAAAARQKNGELARAANTYARYAKDAPPKDKERANALRALTEINGKVGRLTFDAKGATALRVDTETVDVASTTPHYVMPGPHTVFATFPEGEANESVVGVAGEITTVSIARPQAAPQAASAAPAAASAEAASPQAKQDSSKPLPPVVVYAGAGATVLFGALTILSGIDTQSQKDTFEADRTQENLDAGKSKQTRTNVLLAVTGVLAVATVVTAVVLVDWSGGKSKRGASGTALRAGVGPGFLTISGTF